MKIILIMGLPGAGKTTLANELAKLIKCKRLNADEIRKAANDWDFSEEGRTRQSKRMGETAHKMKKKQQDFKSRCFTLCGPNKSTKAFSASTYNQGVS